MNAVHIIHTKFMSLKLGERPLQGSHTVYIIHIPQANQC